MGACATRPGDLKVKGEAPLVVEDAAAPALAVVAGEEKAKADAIVPVVAAGDADPADAGRRRSLSDLLKLDAEETGDGEAGREADDKAAVAADQSASALGDDAGATTASQAPAQDSVAAEQDDGTARELTADPNGDAQEAEEEKRVDPESVQVAAAAPSGEESKAVADDDSSTSA